MKKQARYLMLITLLTLNILLVSATQFENYGTPERGRHVVQCLLGIVQKVTPYIMLALIVLGGLKWLTSADSRQDRLMGKKYIEMALVGFLCVAGLMAVATLLGVPPLLDCSGGEPILPPGVTQQPRLNAPPDNGVCTEPGDC